MALEGFHFFNGFLVLAQALVGQCCSLYFLPFGAQRFDYGGQNQAFDICTRCVVRTQLMAFARVERTFQQGAEDGRFHIAPVGFGCLQQQLHLIAVKGNGRRLGEQAAIELE
ncbi:hypothetical protein D3C80_1245080 [compost metagenome]